MEEDEDEYLLPIAALQHLAYCPRQCALIHIDQIWAENRWTAEGQILHEKCHGEDSEVRRDKRTVRGLRLRSRTLGLVGVADVVEFIRCAKDDPTDRSGTPLVGAKGLWTPRPVEYKRGRKKPDHRDAVQLCAQALCLEEMLGVSIAEGDLYYGASRRRTTVTIDQTLRDETVDLVGRLRALIGSRTLPPPTDDKKRCQECSLRDQCIPEVDQRRRQGERYLKKALDAIRKETSEQEEKSPPCPPF